ncbi:response regulator transcription factor [Acidisoma cellulosilytica]|uniref:Response regulator transcription factor n=1 Tax=Acidisoma cellulosilyticum TaxID=2802395 RepID=A0A963Z3R0_9PROT|nr:response regulator transcription factor [Acidisoma cellulosilyticum]MCB8882208.1 response regulator transcription factor [Acidisoma cellulosilyticum]
MDNTPLDEEVSGTEPDSYRIGSADKASNASTISVGWIADPSLTRDCLKELISRIDTRFVITTFDSPQNLPDKAQGLLDLVVYHAQGADSIDLEELRTLVLSIPPAIPLIILSDAVRLSIDAIAAIMRHNVSGFIYARETSVKMLLSSLAFVRSGGTFMPKDFFVADTKIEKPDGTRPRERPLLTPRETEVLGLIRQGKPNKLIAHALNLSPSTTKIHVRNVMHKLGATNRTQAAIEALRYLRIEVDRQNGG